MKRFISIFAVLLMSVGAEAKVFLKSRTLDGTSSQRVFSSSNESSLLIVELTSVTEANKELLRESGFTLYAYLPDNAFIVKGDAKAISKAGSLIKNIYVYEAVDKLDPELSRRNFLALHQNLSVIAQLTEGADVSAVARAFPELTILDKVTVSSKMGLARIWELAKRSDVLWVERQLPLKIMRFDDEQEAAPVGGNFAYTGYESGTLLMNVQSAYRNGITGQGQLTGFADTGLDKGDLKSLVADFQGQVHKATAIALYGTSWGDPHGHGTHVAGSIAGSGVSSEGNIRGAAFEAKLVAQGMWSDMFDNIFPPAIAAIFGPAYEQGARIHSNSWGAPSSGGRYDSNAAAVDKFMFERQDFLAVFASGNDGQDANKDGVIDERSVASPGSAKNALTVGASKNLILEGGIQKKMSELRDGELKWGVEPIASSKISDDPKGMAAFSSRGPTADGRIKPDVVAPGTNIVSARSSHERAGVGHGEWNKDYVFMAGTSMATPLTSGAATLVRQFLQRRLVTSNVSAALVKATLANTAEDLFPGQFGARERGQEQPTVRPNNHQGWGRVDLSELFSQRKGRFHDERAGLATGQEKSFDIEVTSLETPVRITLAYTDAPGSPVAAKALVNDLDLVVTSPAGQRIFPNRGTNKDSINNMEQVDVVKPLLGTYRVSVRAASVPQGIGGAQPYALVITGAE